MNQKRIGILVSYANLFVGMVVNVFLAPYLIYVLGDVDYSMYKVMQSFAGPLSMFHFGISTIVTRCIVRYDNSENYTKEDKENTLALSYLSSIILVLFIIVAGAIMYHTIPTLYGNSYSRESVFSGQKVFFCFVGSTVFHMLTDVSSGCLIGHHKYTVSSLIQLSKTVLKPFSIILFINLNLGMVGVAMVDLIVSAIAFLFSYIYTTGILKEVPKLHYFDKKQIMEILAFGLALLMQAFVNQINNNVDTMILGVYVEDKSIITMYSSALAIYAIYNSLISVVTNYFLPNATKLVTTNATGKELTDFVIKPGRFQAMIAVACIFGFGLCGRDFISIWIGEKYIDAYGIILMLMIPVTIPLVENAAISILDASLKRIYRSIVLAVMAVLNVIISIFLIQRIGYWGAAIGTAVSLIVGHGILMNIYYARVFNMQILRMFSSIFKGILLSGLVAALICIPIAVVVPMSMAGFLIKGFSFIIAYILILWKFGLNETERIIIKGMIHRK